MADRRWRLGRLARGSSSHRGVDPQNDWIANAVRARFPKLAAALGDRAFDVMLSSYLAKEPVADASLAQTAALADFLVGAAEYPVWYAELAALDRAHLDVLHAPAGTALSRDALDPDGMLRLLPGHSLVDLTTSVDEVWRALDTGASPTKPRALDFPRTVLVWRADGMKVSDRTVDLDEARGLRAASRGTSLAELAKLFGGENPSARALDIVLRWVDSGLLSR